MNEIKSHRDLIAWQRAVELVLDVYALTSRLPADERFGLVSQLRRAAVSVPTNIAEGYGRGTTSDYLRFLRMARGSLFEIDTHLEIVHRLGCASQEEVSHSNQLAKECGRILAALIRSLEAREANNLATVRSTNARSPMPNA